MNKEVYEGKKRRRIIIIQSVVISDNVRIWRISSLLPVRTIHCSQSLRHCCTLLCNLCKFNIWTISRVQISLLNIHTLQGDVNISNIQSDFNISNTQCNFNISDIQGSFNILEYRVTSTFQMYGATFFAAEHNTVISNYLLSNKITCRI